MNAEGRHRLLAERKMLSRLLSELPADRRIERIGLEARLDEVDEALQALGAEEQAPVRVKLLFRGKPIVGSHGMFAEFAAEVLAAFSKAVAAIGASKSGPLGARGVLPGGEDFRFLITDSVPGSFGFVLEEAARQQRNLFPEPSPVESAVEATMSILQASLKTDDELSEALTDTDPRALNAMRAYLDVLAQNEAVCVMEHKGDRFRFATVEQVKKSAARLAQDNIHEVEQEVRGFFLGVLPNRRAFEFKVQDSGEVIAGKVGGDVADPASINRLVEKPTVARVHRRTVGKGRPVYVLLGFSAEEDASP